MNETAYDATSTDDRAEPIRRRAFLAAGAAASVGALAGCTGGGGSGGSDGDGGGGGGGSGVFRLLVSDQPAAIGDFESLDVTLSRARVFEADEDEEVTETAGAGAPEDDAGNESAPEETATAEDGEDDDEDEDDQAGFVEFDLDGVTVDLTEVVGDRAVSVLEGELEEGRYSGIELFVTAAEGVVDGETVEVMVPSNRLRIIKPFEVAADEELSFVFDINVVQRGPNGYNLLPVIGESGVAGRDVDVEEVDADDERSESAEDDGEGEDAGGGNGQSGDVGY